jgi:hypothetical protein
MEGHVGGWRTTFLAAAPAALLLLAGASHLPESPRWLMLNSWQPGILQVCAGIAERWLQCESNPRPSCVALRFGKQSTHVA